jgi:hypothetical protein
VAEINLLVVVAEVLALLELTQDQLRLVLVELV